MVLMPNWLLVSSTKFEHCFDGGQLGFMCAASSSVHACFSSGLGVASSTMGVCGAGFRIRCY